MFLRTDTEESAAAAAPTYTFPSSHLMLYTLWHIRRTSAGPHLLQKKKGVSNRGKKRE